MLTGSCLRIYQQLLILMHAVGYLPPTYSLKHRHAVRAEPMTFFLFWLAQRMNYLYLVFELGCMDKTSHAPRMFHVEDTLSPTSPTTHFSAL